MNSLSHKATTNAMLLFNSQIKKKPPDVQKLFMFMCALARESTVTTDEMKNTMFYLYSKLITKWSCGDINLHK